MKGPRFALAMVAAAGLLAHACLWRDVVLESGPRTSERPADAPAGEGAEVPVEPGREAAPREAAPREDAERAEAPRDPTAGGGAAPEPAAGGDAVPEADDWSPGGNVTPIGGMLIVTPHQAHAQAGAPGVLRLTIPVGTRAGKTGLAELAAEAVAELRTPERPGGSLRGDLARLGAALEVNVEASTTTFDVTFPAEHYREVLAALASSLAKPLDPELMAGAFDRLRVDLAARLGRGWLRAPLLAMVERMRAGRSHALAEVVSQIPLRTAGEVAVFQRAHYRATGSVLALWVPDIPPTDLALGAVGVMPPWLDLGREGGVLPMLVPPPPQEGVYWAPREGAVELGIFVPQFGLDHPLAAEMLVLEECLTLDGLGGRLGAAIEGLVERDVSFDVLPPGDTDHLVLLARANDAIVVPLWEALTQVANSFRLRPPVEAEIRAAAARARLRLQEQLGKPREWVRTVSRMAFRRAAPDVLETVLARLAPPTRLDVAAAIPQFVQRPLALAVVGGQPPVESSRLVQLVDDSVLPGAKVERLLPAAELAQSRADAEKQLARAVEALGGRAALRELLGYHEIASSVSGRGPVIETDTRFTMPDRLRQTTRILATTIETELTAEGGSETSGSQQFPIAVPEARARLAAAARHPLTILARWVRGEVAFRKVGLRLVAGREHAVLEEIAEGAESMRLTIDTGSNLVRGLETRTWDPQIGALVVREEFSDYRNVGGALRAPFYRTRAMDEGEPWERVRTSSFAPVR